MEDKSVKVLVVDDAPSLPQDVFGKTGLMTCDGCKAEDRPFEFEKVYSYTFGHWYPDGLDQLPKPITINYCRSCLVKQPDAQHVAAPKVGRNDPCPCASGKKFKKCHG